MRFLLSVFVWLVSAVSLAQHPAVVRISVPNGQGVSSLGSGVLCGVDEKYGYILTANHVVKGAVSHSTVSFPDGTRSAGQVLCVDAVWDLALIAIHKPNVEPVVLAGQDPDYGDRLTAVGYGGGGEYLETAGVLSARNFPPTAPDVWDWYSIDSSVRSGDSGGPVFNEAGELAGILWGADGQSTTATTVRRLTQFGSCYGGRCYSRPPANPGRQIGVAPRPPAAKPPAQKPPTAIPGPVPICPPQTDLVPVAAIEKRLDDLEKKVAAWKPVPGPAGPAGPRGEPGERGAAGAPGVNGKCDCDLDKLSADVIAKLKLQPIKVQILDEHGKVTFSEEVFLGGEPLRLQLIPRKQ